MGELIFKLLIAVFQALFELVCFYTAKFLLPVISFGKLTVQPLRHPIVVPAVLAAIFGLVFWAIIVIAAVIALRSPT